MRRGSYVGRPYEEKDLSACGLIGFVNQDRRRESGERIMRGIANMHDRGNGLGGGFAAYGIYPDRANLYALHVMYDGPDDAPAVEDYLKRMVIVEGSEEIPLFESRDFTDHPYFKRYFVDLGGRLNGHDTEGDYLVDVVMHVNVRCEGAHVMSSGKNMGVFKGVGFPEDLGEFFRLPEYEGYIWTAHNRFPTNTPGWWGGAHPFGLLDWTIVHNGEISSYGINMRYVKMFGYECTLMTDTEVVAYLFDLLVRRHGLSFEEACTVMAPPFWKDIDGLGEEERTRLVRLRSVYASAGLNGPFAFLLGFNDGIVGLNDRVKLRPLVVGRHGKSVYLSSEEAAIRAVCPEAGEIWAPVAGQPVVVRLDSIEGSKRGKGNKRKKPVLQRA